MIEKQVLCSLNDWISIVYVLYQFFEIHSKTVTYSSRSSCDLENLCISRQNLGPCAREKEMANFVPHFFSACALSSP